jgi:hypothetical protein
MTILRVVFREGGKGSVRLLPNQVFEQVAAEPMLLFLTANHAAGNPLVCRGK